MDLAVGAAGRRRVHVRHGGVRRRRRSFSSPRGYNPGALCMLAMANARSATRERTVILIILTQCTARLQAEQQKRHEGNLSCSSAQSGMAAAALINFS